MHIHSRKTDFKERFHYLLSEIDYSKSEIPEDYILKEKLFWVCSLGHSYECSIGNKMGGKGCPFCAGQKRLKGFNDLATTHPEIATEFDHMKSPRPLDDVSKGCIIKMWWNCPKGHSYEMTPNKRVGGRGCPTCNRRGGASKMEKALVKRITEFYDGPIILNDRTVLKPKELDIYFPDLGKAIEFNGEYWHDRKRWEAERLLLDGITSPERLKVIHTRAQGIALEHIWEQDWLDDPEIVLAGLRYFLLSDLGWDQIVASKENSS